MISNKTIIHLLTKYYNKTGQAPQYTLTTKELGISPTVVRNIFGTWNNALTTANIPIRLRNKLVTIICANCGISCKKQPSQIRNSYHKFCSHHCRATFTNKNRKHTPETKQKISRTIKKYQKEHPWNSRKREKTIHKLVCQECKTIFDSIRKNQKMCSRTCVGISNSRKMSDWLSSNRSHIKGSHQQSYMEQSFEAWLQQNKIPKGISGYLTEIHFINKTTRKNGWVDFVFPRRKLMIELDGSQHQKREQLDKIRDAYLQNKGWKVVRLTHREYTTKTRISEIQQLLHLVPVAGVEPASRI